eukprot:6207141-Pleurochrysis_carterae.AAC.1
MFALCFGRPRQFRPLSVCEAFLGLLCVLTSELPCPTHAAGAPSCERERETETDVGTETETGGEGGREGGRGQQPAAVERYTFVRPCTDAHTGYPGFTRRGSTRARAHLLLAFCQSQMGDLIDSTLGLTF